MGGSAPPPAPADGPSGSIQKPKRKYTRREAKETSLTAEQKAELAVPLDKQTAAEGIFAVLGVMFKAGCLKRARDALERWGVAVPELRDVVSEGKASVRRRASGHPTPGKETHRVNAYNLFVRYAQDLYKRSDLPFVRKYHELHGQNARFGLGPASKLWSSLPTQSKESMAQKLKPFLEDFRSRAVAAAAVPANGSAAAGAGGFKAGPDLLESYLAYEREHPEMSLVKLLGLDGDLDIPAPAAAAAGPAEPGPSAAVAGTAGGPTHMDADGSEEDEEEEAETEEEGEGAEESEKASGSSGEDEEGEEEEQKAASEEASSDEVEEDGDGGSGGSGSGGSSEEEGEKGDGGSGSGSGGASSEDEEDEEEDEAAEAAANGAGGDDDGSEDESSSQSNSGSKSGSGSGGVSGSDGEGESSSGDEVEEEEKD